MERKNAWAAYAGDDGKVEAFAKAYCDFINNGKTERECVAYGEKLAKACSSCWARSCWRRA